jgi:transcriptional regulator with XRE-family HTH domain
MGVEERIARSVVRARIMAAPLPPIEDRRALRRRGRLTQATMASIVDCDRASIARYELGTREPRGAMRERYANALKALSDLVERDVEHVQETARAD